ncbi:hypothetical protein AMTR_s00077p00103150 [Amborella trichopoda]|uniref:Uncharacterized protein n=1 Tax=Amborella trichopoda TaxID=13333 RepID=W1P950_AMBTC|nr:hypothetical protein AMTR_s00077p00103150 [Amborella trichopoda]
MIQLDHIFTRFGLCQAPTGSIGSWAELGLGLALNYAIGAPTTKFNLHHPLLGMDGGCPIISNLGVGVDSESPEPTRVWGSSIMDGPKPGNRSRWSRPGF